MKNLKLFMAAVVVAACACVAPKAQAAGLQFGVKAGLTVNSLKFNQELFDSNNRSGFTAGAMLQFSTPLGFGVDGSVMFTRRFAEVSYNDGGTVSTESMNRSYIEIPINLRWNLGLPGIGQFVTPYIATGPDFSFLCSKKNVDEAWKNHTVDIAWNIGLGVRLVKKVEIGASYGIGLTKAASGSESLYGGPLSFNGKNRFWTITAAYLF